MAAELKINDASTWRLAQQVQVNDGGVWRTIQDIKVNDAGTWRTVFQYIFLDAIVTEGTSGGNSGYSQFGPYGSINTATVASLYTLSEISSEASGPSTTLRIDGFGADPGQSYFSTIVIGGASKTSASASVYSYSAGQASWIWGSYSSLDGSGTSTVVINP